MAGSILRENKYVSELEKRIRCLEKENQYLKHLLTDAGISYSEKETDDIVHEYDPDQGSRIIPRDITETDAKVFFSMFWGRTDVYSKRTIKKSTGEVNYYTQCYNFWKNGCPRISGSKIKCQDCQRQAYKELKKEQIIAHLKGTAEDGTDVIGIFPLLTDDTCRFVVFDFDNHEKGAEKNDFANIDDLWRDEVEDHLPAGGVGNLIALPLQGQALKAGNSAFIDEHWNAYPDQWEVLLSKKKLSKEFIENKIKEWSGGSLDICLLYTSDAADESALG